MSDMTLSLAIKRFRDFCVSELHGKPGSKGWTKIDGNRLCKTCGQKRRRTLYALINEDSAVYLKCFRASCNLKRFATYEDFIDLGFNDTEAIKMLVDRSNRMNIHTFSSGDTRPIIIQDRAPSQAQVDYFNKRTGLKLTYNDVFKYRLIPNITETMKENFDEDDPIYEKFIALNLSDDKDAMTFATSDWGTINYRNINKNIKVILNLADNVSNNGYTLERYEEGNENIKTLVFTEGIFDLINVYNFYAYIYGAKYVATMGFQSLKNDIVYWYKQHLDTVERLIIFADSDISLPYGNLKTYDKNAIDGVIRALDEELGEDAFKEIVLVYNSKSKDFGDRSLPIEPKLETLRQR